MNLFNKQLYDSFRLKQVFKVISRLNNNDIDSILRLIKAIELANATYIDIIANTQIVSLLKSLTKVPVCVSSINPMELYNCVLAGADIVEIGNFDVFYPSNIILSDVEILNLALETRQLIPDKDICVTIPHYLNLFKQVKLARNLEKIGINIIQTEGYATKLNKNSSMYSGDQIHLSANLASASLSSTYVISKCISMPVLTSSCINSVSSPIAFLYGASGIGICSSVLKHENIYDMCMYIREIMYSISHQSSDLINNFSLSSQSRDLMQQFNDSLV